MFSAFGQSSSGPFASQSVFGQTSNASNNPFAPKPFGSTTPFGSQTGGSIFGGTSTGVFGTNQSSSALASTPTFGASSSQAFGSSMPTFGASSTPAFGSSSSSSSFGGTSVFGQKPVFGAFGSSPTQTPPFGSTFQQSQPAFGSSLFGSTTPFGASSQPTFGAASTPAFGSTSTPAFGASTPAFGATNTPAFGATTTPAFGSTTSQAFGSSPVFGSGGAFGASSTPPFGVSSTPAFGASSTSAFGGTSTPAFGASSTPAFGASSTPSFSFGSAPAFGQSTSAFGSSPFGATTSPFGAQSSPFGSQATTSTFGSTSFGQSAFGGQRGGSRVAPYTPTTEVDSGSGTQPAGKLESISAMPVYKDKSHEELRWEDYQLGDKGGPSPAGQSAGGLGFGASSTQSNPFSSAPPFAQPSANPFSASTSSNPFAPKTPSFGTSGFGTSSAPAFSSPFGTSSTSNPFGSSSSATPSLFGTSSTTAFGTSSSPSPFGVSSSSAFGSSPSLFGSASAQGTAGSFGSGLNFANTQSSPLFQSAVPSLGQTGSAFGQTNTSFGQSTTPSFGQSSIFNTPSTGFGGNLFSSTPSLLSSSNPMGFSQTAPSLTTPFQLAQPAQATGAFGFSNFGQTQAAGTSGFGGMPSIFGQNTFGQSSATQSSAIVQPGLVTNPFGTLPAMPQMSIGRAGTASSIQYGISSMPVVDKPAPVRISSLLTSRHLSQRRIRLPARKYYPKNDAPKVPFFSDDEETPSTPKADALFIPRENPRALVIRPMEQWPSRANAEKAASLKDTPTEAHENETQAANGLVKDPIRPVKPNVRPNGVHDDNSNQKGDSYITLTGHRAGEAAIVYEHGADIEALMPKLRHSEYYTEPRIQELAAKERAEPGFCRHVKDFVVGRHGFGSIKFIGETDVRRLDLESLIQFNNREVIVYMDDTKKPPVGQGLNKPAEVTLLNIKCFDKKTGYQYTEGPKIEKYKEMLMRKAKDQGAEFVSYDPIKGEWKFRVNHFSMYKFGDEEDGLNLSVASSS
ncbi:nuclear pore complex protein NUP98A isoform X2 [Malania oleifera]|uniref:nuclear pore complex protein NUP98A isoform X2 n=1 Tax=Malania oleifera TaxID=397392 RepID=UPI0025ADF443|nr:nuclear pore complex protein NUP98A isoform X2 [Malania oleifera]XP_057966768.1 nuclear pore complex protein NUP98A isoform X2 [Malania oleifera]